MMSAVLPRGDRAGAVVHAGHARRDDRRGLERFGIAQARLLVKLELAHELQPVAVGAGDDRHARLVELADEPDHLVEALAEIVAGQIVEQADSR